MSITKREVYFDTTGGFVRFWDWAITQTTLGAMAEPFTPNAREKRDGITTFDPTDEMARIDSMQAASVDKQLLILSGGNHALSGGCLMPRDGR